MEAEHLVVEVKRRTPAGNRHVEERPEEVQHPQQRLEAALPPHHAEVEAAAGACN